jgi:hypothetical protein
MSKEIKSIINVIMAAVALAMGVAIIVLTTINADIAIMDIIKMLAFAVVSLGIFALSNTKKGEKK